MDPLDGSFRMKKNLMSQLFRRHGSGTTLVVHAFADCRLEQKVCWYLDAVTIPMRHTYQPRNSRGRSPITSNPV